MDDEPEYLLKTTITAEDVGRAVLFFASPASDFVTGQALYLDGSWQNGQMVLQGVELASLGDGWIVAG